MAEHIARRLHAEGPKRILALDGGGTRGAISLGFLYEIERQLGERFAAQGVYAEPQDFVLSDYFDLVGGTSVGSMIATMVALGWRVEKMQRRFRDWAPRIFEATLMQRATVGLSRVVFPKFDSRRLRGLLKSELFDWRLGANELKTGLAIIAKRVDTGSVWVLNNNPAGPYFKARPAEGNRKARRGNGEYPLIDLIQASTAAPSFFSPKGIHIYDNSGLDLPTDALFVDGAVSPHNNPALQLFMMAGIDGYNLGGAELEKQEPPRSWPLGAEKLLIVSVGTGNYPETVKPSRSAGIDAVNALKGMVNDGQQLALTMLQWLSDGEDCHHIDRVIGDLRGQHISRCMGGKEAFLSFQRYDVELTSKWLEGNLGRKLRQARIKSMRDFTDPTEIFMLMQIGYEAACKQIKPKHFPEAFDLSRETAVRNPEPVL